MYRIEYGNKKVISLADISACNSDQDLLDLASKIGSFAAEITTYEEVLDAFYTAERREIGVPEFCTVSETGFSPISAEKILKALR